MFSNEMQEMKLDDTVTSAKSNSEDAIALRKGVCHYYTQIMIDCLRSIGITAGYVSKLLCTASQARKSILDGVDATYTWLMVWSSINLQTTSMSETNTD